jgi:hypothetical protein
LDSLCWQRCGERRNSGGLILVEGVTKNRHMCRFFVTPSTQSVLCVESEQKQTLYPYYYAWLSRLYSWIERKRPPGWYFSRKQQNRPNMTRKKALFVNGWCGDALTYLYFVYWTPYLLLQSCHDESIVSFLHFHNVTLCTTSCLDCITRVGCGLWNGDWLLTTRQAARLSWVLMHWAANLIPGAHAKVVPSSCSNNHMTTIVESYFPTWFRDKRLHSMRTI